MTPYQQLTTWFRRATPMQRTSSSLAALIAVALLAWLVTPTSSPNQASALTFGAAQTPTTGGSTGGAAVTGGSPGAVAGPSAVAGAPNTAVLPGSTGSGTSSTGTTGARSVGAGAPRTVTGGPAAAGRSCPAGTDQGVTAKEVTVGITIINIAGAAGNSTIGVPTPDTQEKYWRIVIDAANASGGFGCRTLKPLFVAVNPIDSNDAQQKCLQLANSKPFLVVDTGSLTQVGASDCIPKQKIPMIAHYLTKEQLSKYYPYYISERGVLEDEIRNGVLAAKQHGAFDAAKGFKKLGVLYRSCRPGPIEAKRAALREAGVSSLVEYNLGCPPGQQNTPAELQQAVLTFKNAGATHVTEADVNDFANFTQAAGQQNYKPKYVLANAAMVATTAPNNAQQPDANNFDGAVNYEALAYGENFTPGFKPSAATAACNKIFAAKGEPSVYQQQVAYGGVICSLITFIRAVMENTPQMRREALVQGLQSIGTLQLSYPEGPVNFGVMAKGTPFPKPLWRAVAFVGGCRCFRVTQPAFQKSF